jgi:hypothetical protein
MVQRRPRPKTLLRCPKCLSYEITRESTLFTGAPYLCRKCGYQGMLILEEEVPEGTPEEGAEKKEE